MPYEDAYLVAIPALGLAGAALFASLKTASRPWLIIALVSATAGVAAIVADRLVETDRECIEALFPRLAAAAERGDVDTILAALDPELRPLRADAEKALKQVKPTEVAITRLDVVAHPEISPPVAIVALIVRVSGNVVADGAPGTVLVSLTVEMVKKGGTWTVTNAEVEPGRPGR